MKRRAPFIRALITVFLGCLCATGLRADTLAGHVKTRRDYDLFEVNGMPPDRPLRFYIGENSRFAACCKCLCVTGIMTARYPKLGMRPTSASPTFACEQDSEEFKKDSANLGQFFEMKQARVTGDKVVLEKEDGQTMAFRLGGAELSPP